MDAYVINTNERKLVYELAQLESLVRTLQDVGLQIAALDGNVRTSVLEYTSLDAAHGYIHQAADLIRTRIQELTINLERYDMARAEDLAAEAEEAGHAAA